MSILSVPYVLLYESFKNWCWIKFYEILYWGPCAKDYLSCWNYSAAKFKIIWYWILKDKYLFIQFMFLEEECDIPFKLNYYDFYYEIFMLGKRGVTISVPINTNFHFKFEKVVLKVHKNSLWPTCSNLTITQVL